MSIEDCKHEKYRYDELQTKAFCLNCGQGSSHLFWIRVEQGLIKDRWRN